MAQPVEPRGVVAAHPRPEQVGFPRHRGGVEALQLLDHREEARFAGELGAGGDMLPAQQEAHEVLGGRRFHPAPAGAPGVRVHARQQPTRHPLGVDRLVAVVPLEREAALLEVGQPGQHAPFGERGRRRQLGDGGDTGDLEVTAQDRGRSIFVVGERAGDVVAPFGRAPERLPAVFEHRSASPRRKLVEPLLPLGSRAAHHQRRQEVVQVVGRVGIGRDLTVHLVDGRGVERPDGREVDRQPAAQRDRVGAPVLQLLVVEERVGARGEDLVGEHRRLGGVGVVHGDRTGLHALQQVAHAVDVERLVQRVADGLAHEHVVGDLDRTGDVLLARRRLREDRGHEVVGLHALDRRRIAPTAAEAQHHQGAVEVPAPPGLEHRGVEDGVLQRVLDGRTAEVTGHLLQREAVVGTQREHDGVVARRRLELEVEGAAELLAQRQPQGAVDPPAVRRVHHQLHAAGLVEEALEHELLLRGHRAEHRLRHRQVVDDHRGRLAGDAGGVDQPLARAVGIARGQERVDRGAQLRHLLRQLGGARRRLTHPERHVRGASPASRTRTTPASTLRICHEWVPSRKMSPAIDSTAQSSLTVPMKVSSGSATTR